MAQAAVRAMMAARASAAKRKNKEKLVNEDALSRENKQAFLANLREDEGTLFIANLAKVPT